MPRRRSRFRRAVDLVAAVVFGAATLLCTALGVIAVIDLREPTYWGVFTEQDCIDPHYVKFQGEVCTSVGTWVGDDGRRRLGRVELDGVPGADGTVRASYRPTGILNDRQTGRVHTEGAQTIGIVAPWGFAVFAGGLTAAFVWRVRH